MSDQNVEIVRDHYAATNERDFRRAMSHYAEDVELAVPAGIYGGTFSGREEVGRWFGDWFAAFDTDARFEIKEIIDVDASSVLLVARHTASGRASGAEVESTVIWLYRIRDGKIAHVQGFETRADALETLGLSERA
jgi:ketosteroid isomerase-like protein